MSEEAPSINLDRRFLVERQGKAFALYAGLLDLAHQKGITGIRTQLLQVPSPDNGNVAICYAEVTLIDRASLGSEEEDVTKVFTGIGDASPDNVARIMTPHIIRMAETRAKARALRDATNIGVAAAEELSDMEEEEHHRQAPRQETVRPQSQAQASARAPQTAQSQQPQPRQYDTSRPPSAGPATPNQIKFIYGKGRELGLDERQIEEISTARFGYPPSKLTKQQASDFINSLQAGEIEVTYPAPDDGKSPNLPIIEVPKGDPKYDTWARNIQNASNLRAISAIMEQIDVLHKSRQLSDAALNALTALAIAKEKEMGG